MSSKNELKQLIIQQLKAKGFRAGDKWLFNQQVSVWSSLLLRHSEFVELMHELRDEGFVTIEPEGEGTLSHEHYILTEKIEEVF